MDFCIYLTSISLNLYLIISCWQWKGGSGDRSWVEGEGFEQWGEGVQGYKGKVQNVPRKSQTCGVFKIVVLV